MKVDDDRVYDPRESDKCKESRRSVLVAATELFRHQRQLIRHVEARQCLDHLFLTPPYLRINKRQSRCFYVDENAALCQALARAQPVQAWPRASD
jgi:hypothetical protein